METFSETEVPWEGHGEVGRKNDMGAWCLEECSDRTTRGRRGVPVGDTTKPLQILSQWSVDQTDLDTRDPC